MTSQGPYLSSLLNYYLKTGARVDQQYLKYAHKEYASLKNKVETWRAEYSRLQKERHSLMKKNGVPDDQIPQRKVFSHLMYIENILYHCSNLTSLPDVERVTAACDEMQVLVGDIRDLPKEIEKLEQEMRIVKDEERTDVVMAPESECENAVLWSFLDSFKSMKSPIDHVLFNRARTEHTDLIHNLKSLQLRVDALRKEKYAKASWFSKLTFSDKGHIQPCHLEQLLKKVNQGGYPHMSAVKDAKGELTEIENEIEALKKEIDEQESAKKVCDDVAQVQAHGNGSGSTNKSEYLNGNIWSFLNRMEVVDLPVDEDLFIGAKQNYSDLKRELSSLQPTTNKLKKERQSHTSSSQSNPSIELVHIKTVFKNVHDGRVCDVKLVKDAKEELWKMQETIHGLKKEMDLQEAKKSTNNSQHQQTHTDKLPRTSRPEDEMIAELKETNMLLNDKNVALQIQLEEYKLQLQEMQDHRHRAGRPDTGTRQLHNAIEKLQKENQALKEKKRKNYSDLQVLNERFKNEVSQNRTLTNDLNELRNRFSALAKDKLTRENSAIADLSDVNRPTKLAEKFSDLYDNEWTNAFEEIQDRAMQTKQCLEDNDIIEMLLHFLKITYDFCMSLIADQARQLVRIVLEPGCRCLPHSSHEKAEIAVPKGFETFVHDFKGNMVTLRKSLAVEEDVAQSVRNAFLESAIPKIRESNPYFDGQSVKTYIMTCLDLTWLMAVQDPPMYLHFQVQKGDRFDRDKFRHYTKSGRTVDYIVWPALCLEKPKKDGTMSIASKGIVQPQ